MVNKQDVVLKTPLNTDSAFLRLVAIGTMILDHVGAVFFPQHIEMRVIGRIAFPLFCWGIVLGCLYTRDWKKYALRLLGGAVISQGPYMLALNHSLLELNVMFTLLLGMLAVTGIQSNRRGSAVWMPLICLSVAATLNMDYGWRGVLLIIFMYLCYEKKNGVFSHDDGLLFVLGGYFIRCFCGVRPVIQHLFSCFGVHRPLERNAAGLSEAAGDGSFGAATDPCKHQ